MENHLDGSRKGCCFCSNPFSVSQRTDEHVIPKWLLDLARINRHEKHQVTEVTSTNEVRLLRSSGGHSSVYGRVCSACNNGWLSDLENKTKPIFHKVVSENNVLLDENEIRTLSTWLHKTLALAALSNSGGHKHLVVSDDLRALYRGELPVGQSDVVLGRTIDPCPSKLRLWSHKIRYGVPTSHDLEKEIEGSRCFTGVLHFGRTLLGYVYRYPALKWVTILEPEDTFLVHLWPTASPIHMDMASVPRISDPEAIRFSFVLDARRRR